MARVVALLLCLVAAAAAQGYGSATNSVTLKNGTSFGASRANVPNFLTAEDRRFTVALNWLRQDPARWKSFMTAQGRWDIEEPFLVVGGSLKPNLALHYNPNIAAASHWHAWEMAVMSPANSLVYFPPDHCPKPKEWPGTPCSPPDKFRQANNQLVDVECFRREGCFDPTIDYYNRMDEFGTPIFPAPGSRIAGGNFYAGGTIYTNDVERGVSAAMSIACDSPDPEQPFNCTADSFSGGLDTGKEILYKPIGLRIHGAAYYAQASKKVNYFDTYFAAGPAPDTQNPIASAALMRVNGAGYFVLNYREPNSDFAAPRQVGVLYQAPSAGVTQTALGHNPSAALVYTADASSILALCTGTTPPTIPYAFFAVDSNGDTYRYPETENLNACAGGAAGSTDTVSDPGNGGVTNGVVNFQGTTQTPPPGSNPDLVPTVTFGSFAASVLPAVALLLAAAFAVLAL